MRAMARVSVSARVVRRLGVLSELEAQQSEGVNRAAYMAEKTVLTVPALQVKEMNEAARKRGGSSIGLKRIFPREQGAWKRQRHEAQ